MRQSHDSRPWMYQKAPSYQAAPMQARSYRGRQPSARVAHFFPRPSGGSRASLRDRGTVVRGPGQGPRHNPADVVWGMPIFGEIRLFAGPFSDPTFFPLHANREAGYVERTAGNSLPLMTILASWATSRLHSSQGHGSSIYWHNWHVWTGGNSPRLIRIRRTLSCKSTVHRAETPAG